MGRRRLWWLVAGVVALLVAVAIIVRMTGAQDSSAETSPGATVSSSPTSTSPSPSATPDPSPVPLPAPTAAPGAVDADGRDLVAPFVQADAAARRTPDQPLALTAVATGAALDDLRIAVEELAKGGLTQTGAPTVVSAVVTASDPAAEPPTATVLACLDYSDVDLVNAAGQSAKDQAAPQRVGAILHLVKQDGGWLVSDRTFPDDPNC